MSRRRPHTPAIHGRGVVPYLYLLPAFAFFVPFVLVPFGHSIVLSFFEWDALSPAKYVGLANYRDLLSDEIVRAAFIHAFKLIVFFAFLPITLGLIIASMSATARVPADTGLRTAIFLPQVISTVVVGVTWSWIVAYDGPINQALRAVGLDFMARDWFGSSTWALPTVGVIGAWAATGLCVALFVSGIQQIPTTLYDAAQIDGAGRIREFLAVTWPGLRGPIAVALTLTMIGALRAFDIVFVTTRGGPGTETVVPGFVIYRRAFEQFQLGSAAAIAVILCLLVFGITLLINRIADRRDS